MKKQIILVCFLINIQTLYCTKDSITEHIFTQTKSEQETKKTLKELFALLKKEDNDKLKKFLNEIFSEPTPDSQIRTNFIGCDGAEE